MELILLKDVRGLGKAGQVVKASDGYARNMLIPRKLAVEATDSNKKALEKKHQEEEAQRAAEKAAAEEIKAKIQDKTVELIVKAGDNGKLFGAVTSQDIADALEKKFALKIDKKKIELPSPIKSTGNYDVVLKLFQGVSAKCKVDVKAQ